MLYYNKTVEYFTPVVKVEYKNTQVLSKIIFEAMIEASLKVLKLGIGEELGLVKIVCIDLKDGLYELIFIFNVNK